MDKKSLYAVSRELLLKHQHTSGAFIACPNFPTYRFSWYRDGSYIAYALDRDGNYDSSGAFHNWAAENILKREKQIIQCLERSDRGLAVDERLVLHTRYTLDGEEAEGTWENFQLDGFGAWLWALGEHYRLSGFPLKERHCRAARLIVEYLKHLWRSSCYDCWEEFGDKRHTYTTASIYGGLISAGDLLKTDLAEEIGLIKDWILKRCVKDGSLIKFEGSEVVDASLLGVSFPYGLMSPGDPLMVRTVDRIVAELSGGGGLHRYARDTYYGGGIWILLTAWLGIHFATAKESDRARQILVWICRQADQQGFLPEQLPLALNQEDYLSVWEMKWGAIATPLLWSHAMYMILYKDLEST